MSSYEQALNIARTKTAIVPEFATVAAASDEDRKHHLDEDRYARTKARRWFVVAAAAWLSTPLLVFFVPDPFMPDPTKHDIFFAGVNMMAMVLVLLWAARLSRSRQLRANILVRALAAWNLVYAIGFSFSEINVNCVLSVLLALPTGRSLQLLGERGLDGADDHNSGFEPVRFRGVLIVALVMAGADTMMLLGATAGAGYFVVASYVVEGLEAWGHYLPHFGLTAAAAALMSVNVWGLWRLRTWALFSSMIANVGIAALALSGWLWMGDSYAIALATTAGIQLLLPLPILAAALGLDGPRQYAWVAPLLLRVVVPAAVLVTIVAAWIQVRWFILAAWYSAWY
jgi:hypothetical protein